MNLKLKIYSNYNRELYSARKKSVVSVCWKTLKEYIFSELFEINDSFIAENEATTN